MDPKYPSTLVTHGAPGISHRNAPLILTVLTPYLSLPSTTSVLELASGQGVHICAFASAFPDVLFQPTECDEYGVEQIRKTVKESGGRENVKKARVLDVLEEGDWERLEMEMGGQGEGKVDLVVGANFLHMVPFPEGPEAIFNKLNGIVNPSHGIFAVYGPFKNDAGFFTENDEKFDAMIAAREGGARNGLRSIEAVSRIGEKYGWSLKETVPMHQGNFVLIYEVKKH